MERFLSNLRVRLEEHISPNMMRVIRPFMTVQFVIFMLLGIVNTAVSVSTATLLDILHNAFLAPDNPLRLIAEHSRSNFIFGYIISIITSFFLNCHFTFHQRPTLKKFLKFPISYIPNFIFQYLMVFIFKLKFDAGIHLCGDTRHTAYVCGNETNGIQPKKINYLR